MTSNPVSPLAARLFNDGIGHLQRGILDDASRCFREATAYDPELAAAWHGLAVVHFRSNRLADAKAAILRALALSPEHPPYLLDRARIARKSGEFDEALRVFESLAASLGHPDLCREAADTAFAGGDFESAMRNIERALDRAPSDSGLACNRARILFELGDIEQSQAAYRAALTIAPNQLAAVVSLCETLRFGSPGQSLTPLRDFLARHPEDDDARLQLAMQLVKSDPPFDEAEALLNHLRSSPRHRETASIQLAAVYSRRLRFAEAIALLEDLRRSGDANPAIEFAQARIDYDMGNFPAADERLAAMIANGAASPTVCSTWLMGSHYLEDLSPAELAARHRAVAGAYLHPTPIRVAPARPQPDGRIEIGYLSPDCHTHSVSYFLEPLLAAHDRSKFSVHVFSDSMVFDATNRRLRTLADGWHDTGGRSDHGVYQAIRRSGIRVLVDLAGHTGNNRLSLLGMRAAPVQVTYLGYPDTTGLDAVDYRLSDEICDPPGTSDQRHSETVAHLPFPFLCYLPPADAPPVDECPCLENGSLTFGCFNNFQKIGPRTIALWSQVLRRLPESRLLLKGAAYASDVIRNRFLAQFDRHGIAPARIEFLDRTKDTCQHLGTYRRLDVALDTFPYHGTTTTCEALFMGVPVISLTGDAHMARVGASLLAAVGYPELAVADDEAFVRAACDLAENTSKLAAMRSRLREQMRHSALMDAPRLAAHIEAAYRSMLAATEARQTS